MLVSVAALIAACSGSALPSPPTVAWEVNYFGGCAMVGQCPRYVVWTDGGIEWQLVHSWGTEPRVAATIDERLVEDALAELAAVNLRAVGKRHVRGCTSVMDGVDVSLVVPGESARIGCIDLRGLAADLPAFDAALQAMFAEFGIRAAAAQGARGTSGRRSQHDVELMAMGERSFAERYPWPDQLVALVESGEPCSGPIRVNIALGARVFAGDPEAVSVKWVGAACEP